MFCQSPAANVSDGVANPVRQRGVANPVRQRGVANPVRQRGVANPVRQGATRKECADPFLKNIRLTSFFRTCTKILSETELHF
ncbi:MAG: hypothetical protein DRI57_15595 [Deltaproteobacteria bacterium]|nr:MAG: hypothetical protein DRI57_15595 [Deltaproteobacteria bacterium]